MRSVTVFSACLALALPVVANAGQVCVQNADDEVFLFAAEVRQGERIVSLLKPGERLCALAPQETGGVVSVFASAELAEGCSRLVAAPGGLRILRRYVSFDRCAWDDNTR